MLNFYTIFHLNLMYSSIEEEQRKTVIEKCCYPLLEIAKKGFPISIELSGLTLEIIEHIDPRWVEQFKQLLKDHKIELMGSGYSQIIGPLMPYKLNIQNQLIGLEVYENILSVRPKIALVNEMAYSKGLVDIYKESGYEAIVMEWNNPYRFHKEWNKNWVYYPQIAKGMESEIPVIWSDSIAFQKFQRYVHNQISLEEYIEYLNSHNAEQARFFPLYANDAEIFNFRPGRYETEAGLENDEWRRIQKLFNTLKNKGFGFVFFKDVLKHLQKNILELETAEQPIPVKKQEKYNINRWALTGRNDIDINTKIYRLLQVFKKASPTEDDWKRVLYFASSDFRTHITWKRWKKFSSEFGKFLEKCDAKPISFVVRNIRKTEFKTQDDLFYYSVETEKVKCIFNKKKGFSAKAIVFKNKSEKSLIGTLTHGYYDDISLGADFFSFHSIIEKPGEHKSTNLCETNYSIDKTDDTVKIKTSCHEKEADFFREYEIFKDKIRVYIKISLPKREFAIVHPVSITFIPEHFDKDSLFFATHNGSNDLEVFNLKNRAVNHSQSLSVLISAKNGLGATKGIVAVGDREKTITVVHNQTLSALIPSVYFLPIGDTFFLRLQYSAQEMDETFKPADKPQTIECEFLIY